MRRGVRRDRFTVAARGAVVWLDGTVADGATTLIASVGAQFDGTDAQGVQRFAVRPSIAMRASTVDPAIAFAVQPRLGFEVPFTVGGFDAAAAVYGQALIRPALDVWAPSLTAELRFAPVEGVWVLVAYDTGEQLLAPAGRSGLTFGVEGRHLIRW